MGTSASKVKCDAPLPPPLGAIEIPAPPPPEASEDPSDAGKSDSGSISQAAASASEQPTSNVPNPGPYEQASIPSKRLTSIDTHDGFRCEIQKQLSPYMVAIHSFWLGTSLPDGRNKTYSFVSQVADEEGLLMLNLDPEKKTVNGRIHRALLGGLAMGKVHGGVSPDGSADQILGEVDFGGLTWSGNLKYGSMGGGCVYGLNYYQGITEKLALGGEAMYIAANGNMMSSYTVKYECDAPGGNDANDSIAAAAATTTSFDSKPSSWFCGQLHPAQGMLNLNYKRVVTPNRVTLGAELQMAASLESQVTFGAEFDLSKSKFAVAVDGSGKLQSNLEAALGMAPESPKLNFNAEVDFAKDSMKFGYGLNIS